MAPSCAITAGAKRHNDAPSTHVAVKRVKLAGDAAARLDPRPPVAQQRPAQPKLVASRARAGPSIQSKAHPSHAPGSSRGAPKATGALTSEHAANAVRPSSPAPSAHKHLKRSRSAERSTPASQQQQQQQQQPTRRLVICDDDWDTSPDPEAQPRGAAAAAAAARLSSLPASSKQRAPSSADDAPPSKCRKHTGAQPAPASAAAIRAPQAPPQPSAQPHPPRTATLTRPPIPAPFPRPQRPLSAAEHSKQQPQQQPQPPAPAPEQLQQHPAAPSTGASEMKHITLVSASGNKLRFKMPRSVLEAAVARHRTPSPSLPSSPALSDAPPPPHPAPPPARQAAGPAPTQCPAASHPSMPSDLPACTAAPAAAPAATPLSPARRAHSHLSSDSHYRDRSTSSRPHRRTSANTASVTSSGCRPPTSPPPAYTTAPLHHTPSHLPAPCHPPSPSADPARASKLVIVPFDCEPAPNACPRTAKAPVTHAPHTTATMPLPDACDSTRSHSSCRSTSTTLSLPTSSLSLCSTLLSPPRSDTQKPPLPPASKARPPLPSKRASAPARPTDADAPALLQPPQQGRGAVDRATPQAPAAARLVILDCDDDDDAIPSAPKAPAARRPAPSVPKRVATAPAAKRVPAAAAPPAAAVPTAPSGSVARGDRDAADGQGASTRLLERPPTAAAAAAEWGQFNPTAAASLAASKAVATSEEAHARPLGELASPQHQAVALHTRPASDQPTGGPAPAAGAQPAAPEQGACCSLPAAAAAAPCKQSPPSYATMGGVGDFADFLQDYLETEL